MNWRRKTNLVRPFLWARPPLSRANLTEAKGLTQEQHDGACSDDKTTLPDYLADYQMQPCTEPEQSPAN